MTLQGSKRIIGIDGFLWFNHIIYAEFGFGAWELTQYDHLILVATLPV
jgi:hypothetical protein